MVNGKEGLDNLEDHFSGESLEQGLMPNLDDCDLYEDFPDFDAVPISDSYIVPTINLAYFKTKVVISRHENKFDFALFTDYLERKTIDRMIPKCAPALEECKLSYAPGLPADINGTSIENLLLSEFFVDSLSELLKNRETEIKFLVKPEPKGKYRFICQIKSIKDPDAVLGKLGKKLSYADTYSLEL